MTNSFNTIKSLGVRVSSHEAEGPPPSFWPFTGELKCFVFIIFSCFAKEGPQIVMLHQTWDLSSEGILKTIPKRETSIEA